MLAAIENVVPVLDVPLGAVMVMLEDVPARPQSVLEAVAAPEVIVLNVSVVPDPGVPMVPPTNNLMSEDVIDVLAMVGVTLPAAKFKAIVPEAASKPGPSLKKISLLVDWVAFSFVNVSESVFSEPVAIATWKNPRFVVAQRIATTTIGVTF